MPTHDPLTDARFEDIIAELRDARVPTPETLAGRIEEIAARPAPPPPRRPVADRIPRVRRPAFRLGRIVAIGGGLLAAGALVALIAGTGGSSSSSSGSTTAAAASYAASSPASGGGGAAAPAVTTPMRIISEAPTSDNFQATGRKQHESVQLRIALNDVAGVSAATSSVTRTIQAYGGYVVALSFDAGRTGTSTVIAKVPFAHVQDAIVRFSNLGPVVAEHVDLTDLQRQSDTAEQQIAHLRLQIARIQAQLADPKVTAAAAAVARVRLAELRSTLADQRKVVSQIAGQAAMADFSLDLVTRGPAAHAAAKPSAGVPGAASHALGVLRGAAKAAVWVLIVLSPLLIAGAAWLVARRWLRARRERRLLEQA
jgi:hypothetical protein